MSFLGKSVGTAWLLSAVLCGGCSKSGPAPAGQGAGNIPTPTAPPVTVADPAITAGSAPSAADNAASSNAGKNNGKELLTQIKELTSKPLQGNGPAAVAQQLDKIIDLCEKARAAGLEPAERDQVRETTLQAVAILSQVDSKRRELLTKIDQVSTETLTDTPDGPLADTARFFRTLTHLNIEREGSGNDPSVNPRLFALAKEFAESAPNDPRAGQLLFMIGQNATMDGQDDLAIEIYKFVITIDPDGQLGKLAAGKVALVEAFGKPPEIAGPTLDGTEIDISQFKGKVVLVDFWATWCGPCVAELPNVRSVYEKYHEQGFEVIAISLDRSKAPLEKFVMDEKLPWPQIFFDEEGKTYWDNPIGQKYGIDSIPATLLIDREGNLQKIGVRGKDLETAVVKLLNDGESAPQN